MHCVMVKILVSDAVPKRALVACPSERLHTTAAPPDALHHGRRSKAPRAQRETAHASRHTPQSAEAAPPCGTSVVRIGSLVATSFRKPGAAPGPQTPKYLARASATQEAKRAQTRGQAVR